MGVSLCAFALWCAAATCRVSLPVTHAQDAQGQVLLVDSTFDAKGEDPNSMESRDGLSLIASVPSDWTAPVDYRKGRVYVRVQVLDKPSERSTLLTVCFYHKAQYQETTDEQGNVTVKGLTCTPYAGKYNTTQTLLGKPEVSAFWNKDGYDWTQKPDLIYIVLKNGENEEFVRGDASFYPTNLHVTIALLAEGVQDYSDPASASSAVGTSTAGTGGNSQTAAAGAGGEEDSESGSAGQGGDDLDRYVDPGSSCAAVAPRGRVIGAAGSLACAGSMLLLAFVLRARSRRR
jgi:hypothetical protein